MRSGSINIKQAAEALGMEPAMLAYQLAGKVRSYHVCYQVTMLLIVIMLPCYSLLPSYYMLLIVTVQNGKLWGVNSTFTRH